MSEFKGTKGKWEYDKYKSISVNGKTILINGCIGTTCHEDEEPMANALLISKAPEMLEMLKIARDKFLDLKHDKNLPELQEIQDQIEQLIKEATQL